MLLDANQGARFQAAQPTKQGSLRTHTHTHTLHQRHLTADQGIARERVPGGEWRRGRLVAPSSGAPNSSKTVARTVFYGANFVVLVGLIFLGGLVAKRAT